MTDHNFTALCLAIEANVPVLWWGAPGIGKSARLAGYARATRRHCETVIASILEPSDFAGLPVRDGDRARYLPPEWAVRLVDHDGGILFFDEISTAAPACQAALLRVVFERVAGQLRLPAATHIVAAANPAEQAAGGWDLSHPLANRFLHLESSPDVGAWTNGLLSGFPDPEPVRLPAEWRAYLPASRAKVAAFVKVRPHLLLTVPTDAGKASRGWPSPRSWDMLSTAQAAAESIRAPDDVILPLVVGAIGEGAGLEYATFARELDLPDPEELLRHPGKFVLPERGDMAFAVLASVAAAAIANLTEARWCAAWEILERTCKAGSKDLAARAGMLLGEQRAKVPNYPVPTAVLRELQPLIEAVRGK